MRVTVLSAALLAHAHLRLDSLTQGLWRDVHVAGEPASGAPRAAEPSNVEGVGAQAIEPTQKVDALSNATGPMGKAAPRVERSKVAPWTHRGGHAMRAEKRFNHSSRQHVIASAPVNQTLLGGKKEALHPWMQDAQDDAIYSVLYADGEYALTSNNEHKTCDKSKSIDAIVAKFQLTDRIGRFPQIPTSFGWEEMRKMLSTYIISMPNASKWGAMEKHLDGLDLAYTKCDGLHATHAGWEALKKTHAVGDCPYPRDVKDKPWASCGNLGNLMAHLSCMKTAYDDWDQAGRPSRLIYIGEDDEFVSSRGLATAAALLSKVNGRFDVLMFNTLRSTGNDVADGWFRVDHTLKKECPSTTWDNGGDTRLNSWSNAAALLNPEAIPVLLDVVQAYYGTYDGVSYKRGAPLDKFLSNFYAAAAPSFITYGAHTNQASKHVEGRDERKSTKWNCDQ